MLLNLVSAYQCYQLKEGQLDCNHNFCTGCYDGLRATNPRYCENQACIPFDDSSSELNILSPTEKISASRSILLSIESSKPSSFYYGRNGDGRWNRLAKNVTKYNKKFIFSEGLNNIIIKSVDAQGNSLNKEINIVVDSKRPTIRTATKSKIINGSFNIKFLEDNPKKLGIFINDNFNEISLENCHKERSYFVCSFFVDLTELNNNEINYYFSIEDIAGNKAVNVKTKAKVNLQFDNLASVQNLKGGQDE